MRSTICAENGRAVLTLPGGPGLGLVDLSGLLLAPHVALLLAADLERFAKAAEAARIAAGVKL